MKISVSWYRDRDSSLCIVSHYYEELEGLRYHRTGETYNFDSTVVPVFRSHGRDPAVYGSQVI